ncbi:MAG: hypothetical protein J6U04_06335 [Salinivirgaceae bacterium]|nr:hypothetical protein [Salinivirgaceae bacterium]
MTKGIKILLAVAAGFGFYKLLTKKGVLKSTGENFAARAEIANALSFSNSALNIPIQFAFSQQRESTVSIDAVSLAYNGYDLSSVNYYSVSSQRMGKNGVISMICAVPYSRLIAVIGNDITDWITKASYDELLKGLQVKATIGVDDYKLSFAQPLNEIQKYSLSLLGVNGLGLTASTVRNIRPISDYAAYIPAKTELNREDKILIPDGNEHDTVALMRKVAQTTKSDTAKLAQWLKRPTLKDTLQNIWTFVYTHIQYVKDNPMVEQVRRPLRTLYDQAGDCDCFATLIASILENLGINYKFRVAAYQRGWQHVYVIVPYEGGYYTVDPVLDQCFAEKQPTKTFEG